MINWKKITSAEFEGKNFANKKKLKILQIVLGLAAYRNSCESGL
jgi:hypothetical protein